MFKNKLIANLNKSWGLVIWNWEFVDDSIPSSQFPVPSDTYDLILTTVSQ
jgi:hypothetical protein